MTIREDSPSRGAGPRTEIDPEIVRRARQGDQDAFAELYRSYRAQLLRFCWSRLHDDRDAEDAVEETFLRALLAVGRLDEQSSIYPWLHVIARNVCVDLQRHHAYERRFEDRPQPSMSISTEELVLASLDAASARAAIGRLSPSDREVLTLRGSFDMSSTEIASRTGLPTKAVDRTVYRARQRLRRELRTTIGVGQLSVLAFPRTRGLLARLRAAALSHSADVLPSYPSLHVDSAALIRLLIAGSAAGGVFFTVAHGGATSSAEVARPVVAQASSPHRTPLSAIAFHPAGVDRRSDRGRVLLPGSPGAAEPNGVDRSSVDGTTTDNPAPETAHPTSSVAAERAAPNAPGSVTAITRSGGRGTASVSAAVRRTASTGAHSVRRHGGAVVHSVTETIPSVSAGLGIATPSTVTNTVVSTATSGTAAVVSASAGLVGNTASATGSLLQQIAAATSTAIPDGSALAPTAPPSSASTGASGPIADVEGALGR